MRFKNNIGPQVQKLRNALAWSQPVLAAKLQIAGWDTTRSAISKIEGRTIYVDDRALVFLAEVLKVEVSELFPKRDKSCRLHEFMRKIETTRF